MPFVQGMIKNAEMGSNPQSIGSRQVAEVANHQVAEVVMVACPYRLKVRILAKQSNLKKKKHASVIICRICKICKIRYFFVNT